ncbi:hypothetical protein H1C71_026980 [Ictidomys tridecemlineatus]|nr:hypothetical protein H1C71_026980 [Ictidomys tridecemlineatus]
MEKPKESEAGSLDRHQDSPSTLCFCSCGRNSADDFTQISASWSFGLLAGGGRSSECRREMESFSFLSTRRFCQQCHSQSAPPETLCPEAAISPSGFLGRPDHWTLTFQGVSSNCFQARRLRREKGCFSRQRNMKDFTAEHQLCLNLSQ